METQKSLDPLFFRQLGPIWTMVRAPSTVCEPVGVAVPVNVVAVAARPIV
jgi:hypothetical protein